jgi:hypothetical protein
LTEKNDNLDLTQRIEAAIAGYSSIDFLRLYRKANYLILGTGLTTTVELFNEALARTLEGTRIWPQGVAFEAFIWNAMKSIANGYRNLQSRKEEILSTDLIHNNDDQSIDPIAELGHLTSSVEDTLIEKEKRQLAEIDLTKIENYFKDDDEVTLIIMAIEDGITAKDLCCSYEMTNTQYQTARKRFRRGIDHLFPGRRKL